METTPEQGYSAENVWWTKTEIFVNLPRKVCCLVDMYIYKRMSVDYDDEETDHILAEADIIIADEPRPTPEIFDAVTSPTKDAENTEEMAPREGSEPLPEASS